MLRAAVIFLSLLLASPAASQSVDPKDLEALTKAQAQAKAKADTLAKENAKVETEILRYKEDLRRSAAESASYERASREISAKLIKLSREETQFSGRLSDDRKAQGKLLAALQRLSMTPAAAITARAKTATQAARASMIISSLTAQLEERSTIFTQQLNDLTRVRTQMAEERAKLTENETVLSKKRNSIRTLVKTKACLLYSSPSPRDRQKSRMPSSA